MLPFVLYLLCLCSCQPAEPATTREQLMMSGRNLDLAPIYASFVPQTWQKVSSSGDLLDTMQPIAEFTIDEGRITIHNFPSDTLNQRIPAKTQVMRWAKHHGSGTTTAVSHDGYVGQRFETETVLAWILQLDPELYLALTGPLTGESQIQQRADIAIKAASPADWLDRHRGDIEFFADHFHLIEPLILDP